MLYIDSEETVYLEMSSLMKKILNIREVGLLIETTITIMAKAITITSITMTS